MKPVKSMDSFFVAIRKFMEEMRDVGVLEDFSFSYSLKESFEDVPLQFCIKAFKKLQRECKTITKIIREAASPIHNTCMVPHLSVCADNTDIVNSPILEFHIPASPETATAEIPAFDVSHFDVQQPTHVGLSSGCASNNLVIPFSKLNITRHSENAIHDDHPTMNQAASPNFLTHSVGLIQDDSQYLVPSADYSSARTRLKQTNPVYLAPDQFYSSAVCHSKVNIESAESVENRSRDAAANPKENEPNPGFIEHIPFLCCKICGIACLTMTEFSPHTCKLNANNQMLSSERIVADISELSRLKKFICNACRVEFRTYCRVLYHLQKCSPGPYICNACSKPFPTQKALNYHKQKAHIGEKCFLCEECGRQFERKTSLRKHSVLRHELETISGGKKTRSHFQCESCPKTFIKKIFLTNHQLRMHGLDKKFRCQTCGNRFMNRNSLLTHSEIHEEKKKFVCSRCSKAFRRKETLQDHTRIHTGDRPYQCPRCRKTFVSKSRLNDHINRHNGERRYCCPECPKSYAAAWDLKKHIQKKHNKDLQSVPVTVIPSQSSDTDQQNAFACCHSGSPTALESHSKIQHRLQVNPPALNVFDVAPLRLLETSASQFTL